MSDNVTVKVLLKVEGWFTATPYEPGDMLHEAISFTTGYPACGHIDRLLRIILEQLNIDEPHADWAKEYRNGRSRSLSVGDVVIVGEQAFAVEPDGWKPVRVEAFQIWHDGEPMFLVVDQ
jgi:hypothetical protein